MAAKVRVRIAPSPTGEVHIGTIWMALFNWLYAKKHQGKFILRIEDTDRNRYVAGSVERIYEALKWIGIEPDEGPEQGGEFGPYIQSERLKLYQKYAKQLVDHGFAYHCFCSPERLEEMRATQQAAKMPSRYDKHCLSLTATEVQQRLTAGEAATIRLNMPTTGTVTHHDLIRGDVTFRYDLIDDSVLLKSDGFPTYHLAVVVDDHLMEINPVIRAEEWLPSIPKHLYLYKCLSWTPPQFAHLPLILGTDRSKLSKRHGATSALTYRDAGYLPAAMQNFLVLMGWHPKGDRETISLEEVIKDFDLADINPSGAIFDRTKLDWFNGYYIRQLNSDDLIANSEPFIKLPGWTEQGRDWKIAALNLVRERLHHLSELDQLLMFSTATGWEQMLANADLGLINQKNLKPGDAPEALRWGLDICLKIENTWSASLLREKILKEIKDAGRTNMSVLWPLRFGLSLAVASPDVFDIMELIGSIETKRRVNIVLERLKD